MTNNVYAGVDSSCSATDSAIETPVTIESDCRQSKVTDFFYSFH